MTALLRRLIHRLPLWRHGNLLDEDIWTEVHIVIPRNGDKPKMFTPKSDHPSEHFVQVVTNAVVSAAIDFARLYGVNVAGFLGQPPCPHCGKIIAGPPGPPPQ